MPRRSHRKSKTGCQNCRTRHIKCDEGREGCQQCEKHGIRCDYLTLSDRVAGLLRRTSPCDESMRSPARLPRPQALEDTDKGDAENLNMSTLELFHHFLMLASPETFPGRTRDLWKTEIPLLAFKHEFLMHGILALAAFHQARTRSGESQMIESLAIHHQNKAVALYRPETTKIDAYNAEAVFAFALLLMPMEIGSPQGDKSPLSKATHSLSICCGFTLVQQQTLPTVMAGPFAPLGQFSELYEGCGMTPVAEDDDCWHFRGLQLRNPLSLLRILVAARNDLWSVSVEDTTIYEAIINSLRECFFHVESTCTLLFSPPQIPTWGASLPDVVLRDLRQFHPLALVILGYFCIAFAAVEKRWFARGWAMSTLMDIQQNLPNSWQYWIDWPVDTIRTLETRR